MKKPYTKNQFKVLAAAFRGNASRAQFDNRRSKTRAINDMVDAKLVYAGFSGGKLTPAGLRAYVDMCERYDADSGCLAYSDRAREARNALSNAKKRQEALDALFATGGKNEPA